MSDASEKKEQEFADLLAVYDDALAARSNLGLEIVSTFHDVPSDVADRLETAKECLVLLDRVWPRPSPDGLALTQSVGRFQIVRELGRGGFGIVFLAYDPQLSRQVALKVPQASWLMTLDSHQRFLREAEAAARLSHPHIVTVYEVGEAGPISYIAAEYCQGPTLTGWLAASKHPVPVREAVHFIAKLALAMQHAHARGVLHRDLNPNNILLECSALNGDVAIEDRSLLSIITPKIGDFGLAKMLEGDEGGTRTGAILGTLTHMAPEQAEGRIRDISVQTDIYALGVMLYQLLTGEPPHQGRTTTETLQRILLAEPKSPRQLRSEIPRDLAAVCLKCLEKSPSRRYDSATELADDLQCWLDGRPTLAVQLPPRERVWRWIKRRPAVAAGIGASLAVVLAVLVSTIIYQGHLNDAVDAARREATENRNLLYTADVRSAHEAREARNGPESLRGLAQQVPQPGEQDRREFAWKYLQNAAHSEYATLKGHVGDVYHVAFSANGRSLVSGGRDRLIRIWDVEQQRLVQTLKGHQADVNLVGFVTDKIIVSASDDGSVRLWDSVRGEAITSLEAHDGEVTALAIAPASDLIASGGRAGVVHFWNPSTGVRLWSSDAFAGVESLVFSPNTQTLVAGHQDGSIRWWDVSSRKLVHQELVDGETPAMLAYSNDFDQVAAVSRTGRISTYRRMATKWQTSFRYVLPSKSIGSHAAAFSPRDNSLAIGARDGRISLWRSGRGLEPYRDMLGHPERVWTLAWAPHGCTMASASADGTIKLWNVLQSPDGPSVYPCLANDTLKSLAVSPDDQSLITMGNDGRMRCWDRPTHRLLATSNGWNTNNQSVQFLADTSTVAAIDKHGRLQTMDLRSTRSERPLLLNDMGSACAMTLSGDKKLLAVGRLRNSAAVYEANTGRLLQQFSARALDVRNVALSWDGGLLATAGVGPQIELWDTNTGQLKHVLPGHDNVTWCSVFSPDGKLLISGGSDDLIRIWDVDSGHLRETLLARAFVLSLAVSPDGRTLASGSQEPAEVKLWDLTTSGQLMQLDGVTGPMHSLAFSHDGRRLFGAGASKDLKSSELLEWSVESKHSLAESDEPAQKLEIQKEFVVAGPTDKNLAAMEPAIVDLFQAANQFARREGFSFGYPCFHPEASTEACATQAVCVRDLHARTIWVPANDLMDATSHFRCDFGTQDELLTYLTDRLQRWSRRQGYVSALPTCRSGIDVDSALRFETTLLWGSGCETLRFKVPKTVALTNTKTLFHAVHAWAVKKGFVSGVPVLSAGPGQMECVVFGSDRAELRDMPADSQKGTSSRP